MNALKKTLLFFALLLLVGTAIAYISGNGFFVKAIAFNFANVDDYEIFENDTVSVGQPQAWNVSKNFNKIPLPDTLQNSLESIGSLAFLVIKNGEVLSEKYWDGYSDSSLSGSFSVAKSITSLLIGCAIKDGNIKSVDQPVGDFIPSFAMGEKAKMTIRHLLTMTSGTDFNESYANPFSITTEIYYGTNLAETAESVDMERPPGTQYEYKSGNTALLGIIVEKATGKRLAEYAAEKLWQPLGAEHAALWSTDTKNGLAKAYCCFSTNARDFARIGQLMLDSGKWNGINIIDSAYFAASITPCMVPDVTGNPCNYYGFQWWLVPDRKGVFYARGILGQYIIVIPEQNTVVVRLGEVKSPILKNNTPKLVYDILNWVPNLP